MNDDGDRSDNDPEYQKGIKMDKKKDKSKKIKKAPVEEKKKCEDK